MGKSRKPVDNRQQKISTFFFKQTSAKPFVLSDKTNAEASPYFSNRVSPEIVVLSDDECTTSKKSPIKNKSNDSESIQNVTTESKDLSPKLISPKKDLHNIEKAHLNGEATPNHSSIKRKLEDSESSPDVIPATPKSESSEPNGKNKKRRLKLNTLKMHRQRSIASASHKSPCKKLKYEETENICFDVQNRKISPVQGVTEIEKFAEVICKETKNYMLDHSKKVESKNIEMGKECLSIHSENLIHVMKADNLLLGNIETVKLFGGKIQNLKSNSDSSVKSLDVKTKLNNVSSVKQCLDINGSENCSELTDNEVISKDSSGMKETLCSNILAKTTKLVELNNRIECSNNSTMSTDRTAETVKAIELCRTKQCLDETNSAIINGSAEFLKPPEQHVKIIEKCSDLNSTKSINYSIESKSTELNNTKKFSDQNSLVKANKTDVFVKSTKLNSIKQYSNQTNVISLNNIAKYESNCETVCSDYNNAISTESNITKQFLDQIIITDTNKRVKSDMKMTVLNSQSVTEKIPDLNKTITTAKTRPSTEEVSRVIDATVTQKADGSCTTMPELPSDWIKVEDWDYSTMEGESEGAVTKETLNLGTLQRCEIVDLEDIKKWEKLMKLRSTQTKEIATCLVKDFWVNTSLSVGDIVSIKACRSGTTWLIDNSGGLLVHHPDTLISSTAVVGSLFCPRRGVLSEWFRGIDGDSRIMVIGSLVHELLQEVLERKIVAESDILTLVHEIISRPVSIKMLYSSRMSKQETLTELQEFVPRIVKFVELYVRGIGIPGPDNFKGSICAIHDIEENIWEPKLGIKGKVDVTTEVKIHQHRKVMPLEVKTGRTSFSAEHKGQVTLYTMMMSQMGNDVKSGLLLYLRDGSMQEIKSRNNEWRDLTILRNQLAHFITRIPAIHDGNTTFKPPQLPEPISHQSACGKCPYLTLCTSFLSCDGLDRLPTNNPLSTFTVSATSHLSPQHIDYLVHWTGLLLLEEAEMSNSFHQKDLWCLSPEKREKRGKCISSVVISGKVVMNGDLYRHTFQKSSGSSDLQLSGFTVGDYVIISTDKHLAVASGTIQDITHSSVTLSLNRNITQSNSNCVFHIDTYTLQTGKVFNLTNLGCLMDNTDSAAKLRRLIINKEKPTFVEKLHSSIMRPGKSILKPLNMGQRRAVVMTLTANDYFLIKGMPGTGKTATVVALVELLVKLGQSVLITSHTHSAVDNVLLKLMARGVDFLRLGSSSRIHSQLAEKSEQHLTSDCTTPEQLESVYNSKLVVGTTCLGAGHPLFTRRIFDICIVDESTQVLQVSVLRPLLCAKKFVLIGDPEQLPPVIKSKKAKELGMSESLFARLDSPGVTVCLDLQYRMNQSITDVANGLSYNGQLKCGSEEVSLVTLQLPNQHLVLGELAEEVWLSPILSSSMDNSVLMLDTGATCRMLDQNAIGVFKEMLEGVSKEERGCTNLCEAAVIHRVITLLIKGGVPGNNVGVIAPYRAQVALLRKIVTCDIVEVNTVDQYQGRDKDVIIFSCTKSESSDSSVNNKETEILGDKRRLTVAITRAKQKLIIIGDVTTLKKYSPFSQLLECMSPSSIHILSDSTNGFEWSKIMLKLREACTSVL